MRQARAMMEKYQLEQSDLDMYEIEEHSARSGSKMNPAQWEANLAQIIAKAYACRLVFMAGLGDWRFIGEMAEVAGYTMTVLLRKVRQARREYIGNDLKRCKPANKTKRADQFCDGCGLCAKRCCSSQAPRHQLRPRHTCSSITPS
ncbi:DUF7168 domain-containing protein [Ectopseudomonas oleovorans]|uniref:DUF7168 domain-containing protein n=1 Tax=Ectopseudomonas oleovorans TaxID=301 RepID=UPI003F19681A